MKKVLVVLMVAALATASQASTVSWNYDNNGTVGNPDGSYNGDMVAGVGSYATVGWNNTWWANPTTDLVDNTGAVTSIDIAYSSYNSYSIGGHPGQDDDGTYNKELINGYLNAGPAGWNPPQTYSDVTFSQIVAEGDSYEIVVYISSDVAGREFYVTDGTTIYYGNTLGPASIPASPSNAVFAQATDTTEDGYLVGANYAVFSGLTGSSQTITCQFRDADEWGGIAAAQVVGVVPEPATLVLLGLGSLVTLRKRK